MRFVACILAASIACAGCSTSGGLTGGAVSVVSSSELPAPTRADLAGTPKPYVIGAYDKLSITVFGVEELSLEEIQVDGSGQISMPLIGVVEAAGTTPGELGALIEGRLRGRYVRQPQVSVNLAEPVSQLLTVDGQVENPGLYPVLGQMSLMRAIATAGGASEFAKLEEVVVFRTVEGQRLAALYNLGAIRRGEYADPDIYANDVIVVGDSNARRLFKDVLAAAPLITTPLIILLRNNN